MLNVKEGRELGRINDQCCCITLFKQRSKSTGVTISSWLNSTESNVRIC